MTTVAFLGIGLMGRPMVENLLEAGFELRLWNRTRSKAEAFKGRATIADTPADAVTGADVVITMLENGPVVEEVLAAEGTLDALAPGTLVIDMSSIPPATARALAEDIRYRGARPLDAPVSGGTRGAAAGTLSIMAGGHRDDFEDAQAVLRALGKATYIGPSGAGQLAKLANQAVVGITIGAVSEALLLAARGGADPAAVREALMGGFAGSAILDQHGQRMLERNFEPGAPARIQLKDLRMILDEARAEDLTLPLSERVYEAYRALIAEGHADVDHSGLLLHLEHLNQQRLSDE
ncbi:NAD(P)-dependent oxidoreductase [Marinobacteraceae bacterium S3BR75-40.1]